MARQAATRPAHAQMGNISNSANINASFRHSEEVQTALPHARGSLGRTGFRAAHVRWRKNVQCWWSLDPGVRNRGMKGNPEPARAVDGNQCFGHDWKYKPK